jgi:hypothetical protein
MESSLRNREEQLIAIRIVDLKRVVPPPGFLRGHRTLAELTAKILESGRCELDEQAPPVAPHRVLAEDDLALTVIDLADRSGAVACVPPFSKPSTST